MACEDTETGCLDLLAENYSVFAVNECDSCCSYPKLNIAFNFINDSLTYNIGDTLVMTNNDSVIVYKFKFLVSNFVFGNPQNSYVISDSLHKADISLKDDFAFFERETTRAVGTTRFSDSLSYVKYYFGFDNANVEQLKPFESIDQTSNLDLALDSLYDIKLDKYIAAEFSFEYLPIDTILVFEIPSLGVNPRTASIDRFVGLGANWTLTISLDLKILLQSIDFRQNHINVEEELSENIIEAIEIK